MANVKTALKENAEQISEREENEYTERKDILSNKDLKKPNFLTDVSDEQWITSSADERHDLLFYYLINNKPPKENMDKEKWKNATEHERFKMLFN